MRPTAAIFFSAFIAAYSSLSPQQQPLVPQLECMRDSVLLRFFPEEPFSGHVYVKGFFRSKSCHLDYTRYPVFEPISFLIPYDGDCAVYKQQLTNPPGVLYGFIVVVQHHSLFVTRLDKAYCVSCSYRSTHAELTQTLQIGNLPTTVLSNEDPLPTCCYNVLSETPNGGSVQYADVGDTLIHSWNCNSGAYGMLIHSCKARSPDGKEFELIDDRGCVRDESLLPPLKYTANLTSAYTKVSAFKFADEMVVHFACQITLCTIDENGCEGITPPTCVFVPLPSTANYTTVGNQTASDRSPRSSKAKKSIKEKAEAPPWTATVIPERLTQKAIGRGTRVNKATESHEGDKTSSAASEAVGIRSSKMRRRSTAQKRRQNNVVRFGHSERMSPGVESTAKERITFEIVAENTIIFKSSLPQINFT